jgi:hypothetical protein
VRFWSESRVSLRIYLLKSLNMRAYIINGFNHRGPLTFLIFYKKFEPLVAAEGQRRSRLALGGWQMRQTVLALILTVSAVPAYAYGPWWHHYGAPAPLIGTGLPITLIAGGLWIGRWVRRRLKQSS